MRYSQSLYCYVLIALLFTSAVSAHEYPTQPPVAVPYGTCFAVGGSSSFSQSRCLPNTQSPSPCDSYAPSASPFSIPTAAATWLGSNTTGSLGWVPNNKNGAPSPSSCTARTVRCASNKTWAWSNTGGRCNDLASACDPEHTLLAIPMGIMSHRCVDIPANQCGEGEIFDHSVDECIIPEDECAEGESYDSDMGFCHESCSTTEHFDIPEGMCAPNCTGGQENYFLDMGTGKKAYCGDSMDQPPKTCQNILGYINDKQICGDKKDECDASGGTYGHVNGSEVCLPQDYPDSLPTCDSNQVITITEAGYVCSTPERPDEPDDSENPDDSDIDGDGIPDKDDPDMDGDGTPNGEDGDKDGDGIPNGDDGEPEGPGEEDSSVSGGSCEERPTCKGDAVDCAILYQVWATRCEGDKATLEGSCGSEPTCEGDAVDCAILKTDWRGKCAAEEGAAQADLVDTYKGENSISRIEKGNIDVESEIAGVFSPAEITGTCPAPKSVNLNGQSYSVEYTKICEVAAMVKPFVLIVASLIGVKIIHGAF